MNLERKHQSTIESHLENFDPMRQSVDDAARDCTERIARAEGQYLFGSTNAAFYGSLLRAAPHFSTLHGYIRERFEYARERFEASARELTIFQENLKNNYADLINRFYEVAERKVSLRDDYGEERWEELDAEVNVVINKIAQREGRSDKNRYAQFSEFLKQSFKERHANKQAHPIKAPNFATMTGEQFEVYLMDLLSRLGYTDICGTSRTGDQGADLLAKRHGKKIVIQAKNYRGTVGNAAVQEVWAAVPFYSADEGWVITNSTFTTQAKELAQRTGIKLVDGYELARMAGY